MFKLDGNVIQLDAPFDYNGTSYPANWLRLSSPEEREALGITEEPDFIYLDQRFYDYDNQPRDLAELKTAYLAALKRTVKGILQDTDWVVLRKLETGADIPSEILAFRNDVREKNLQAEAELVGASDTPALKEVVDGLPWYLYT